MILPGTHKRKSHQRLTHLHVIMLQRYGLCDIRFSIIKLICRPRLKMMISHQLMTAVMVVYRVVKVVEEEKGRHLSTRKRPVMNVCNHKSRVVKGALQSD